MQKFNLKEISKVVCFETQESIPECDWLEALLTSIVTLHGSKGQYAIVENGVVEYCKGFSKASLQDFVTTLQKRQDLQEQLIELEDILKGFDAPVKEESSVHLSQVYSGMSVILRNGQRVVVTSIQKHLDVYIITFKNNPLLYSYEYNGSYIKGHKHNFDIVVVMG